MKRNFVISYIIYPFDIMIFLNTPYKEIKSILSKRLTKEQHSEIKGFKGKYDARTIMFSGGATVVNFKNIGYGAIAHEVFHAVEFLMDRITTPLTQDTDESYAYLIGYIVDEIHKNIGALEEYKR